MVIDRESTRDPDAVGLYRRGRQTAESRHLARVRSEHGLALGPRGQTVAVACQYVERIGIQHHGDICPIDEPCDDRSHTRGDPETGSNRHDVARKIENRLETLRGHGAIVRIGKRFGYMVAMFYFGLLAGLAAIFAFLADVLFAPALLTLVVRRREERAASRS